MTNDAGRGRESAAPAERCRCLRHDGRCDRTEIVNGYCRDCAVYCDPPTLDVENGPCPDCGRPWRCIGNTISGATVFCCSAQVARHRMLRESWSGAICYRPGPSNVVAATMAPGRTS